MFCLQQKLSKINYWYVQHNNEINYYDYALKIEYTKIHHRAFTYILNNLLKYRLSNKFTACYKIILKLLSL